MEQGGELPYMATPQPRTSPRSAAAAGAEPRSWGDVPDNILARVSAFLPCCADRVHMVCTSRHWNRAVRGIGRPPPPVLPALPPLPPQLPWLIFPNAVSPVFYSPIARRYHRLCRLPPDIRRARSCGSGDGGWLVLALGPRHRYELYNLGSGQRIPLPPGLTTARNAQFPLVLRAATLSSERTPGIPYIVAAIVLASSGFTAAFLIEGDDSWFSPGGMRAMGPQDVIFYQGAFFFVGADESIVTFWPFHGPEGDVTFARVDWDVPQRQDFGEDLGFVHGHGTMRRYLVVSRGRLLMVVRYAYHDVGTLTFRVFRFLITAPLTEVQPPRAIWEDLGNELDDRMLFLGRGCSRSFEVADYGGFEESTIYFLDESMATVPSPDGTRWYSFTDMGRFDMEQVATTPWPEGHPIFSDNAPPTWWLH